MDIITQENQDILFVEKGYERWIKEDLSFTFVPHTLEELESILEFIKVHIKAFDEQEHWVSAYNRLHTTIDEKV
jgi:hypothetical protein